MFITNEMIKRIQTVAYDASAKLDDIGCKGAPDLVMEILSPSTQRHDKLTKFNLYQRAAWRGCIPR